jgi:hypothetical protein
MATLHKTFIDGEILTASDVNTALNPTVADHIPYAMAAGTINFTMSGSTGAQLDVIFPTGRFTSAPIVVANVNSGAGGAIKATLLVISPSATQVSLRLELNSVSAGTYPVTWVAVQMTK